MVLVLWIYGNYGPYEKIGKVTNQVPHVCPNYIFGPSYLSKTKRTLIIKKPKSNPTQLQTHPSFSLAQQTNQPKLPTQFI